MAELAPIDRTKLENSEHYFFDEQEVRSTIKEDGMKFRNVYHKAYQDNGSKVSIKVAIFNSEEVFRKFLDRYDLEYVGVFPGNSSGERKWIWASRNLVLQTNKDPTTEPEGEASGMLLTGEWDLLRDVYIYLHIDAEDIMYKDMYLYQDQKQKTYDSGGL